MRARARRRVFNLIGTVVFALVALILLLADTSPQYVSTEKLREVLLRKSGVCVGGVCYFENMSSSLVECVCVGPFSKKSLGVELV